MFDLKSFLAIVGRIGYEGATSLANKLTAARAALLDQITAARMAELDAANIPADVDNLKLATYQAVYYDAVNGVAGTTWPIGTRDRPVNNVADLQTILTARGLDVVVIIGTLTLTGNMPNTIFMSEAGSTGATGPTLNLGGFSVDNCVIVGLYVTGVGSGFPYLFRCEMNCTLSSGFEAHNCVAGAVVATSAAALSAFYDCIFRGSVNLNALGTGLRIVNGHGGVDINNATVGTHYIEIFGRLTLAVTCTPGATFHIYEASYVLNLGTSVINDYRRLSVMDFWSNPQEEVTIPGIAGTLTLPDVTVADLPAGATIVRAIAMVKFRVIENTNAAANKLDGATVAATSQVVRVRDDTPGVWRDAINFVDDQFGIGAGPLREGGDVLIGSVDIAVEVDGNDTYNFQYLLAKADLGSLNMNDVQTGLRIWYSV